VTDIDVATIKTMLAEVLGPAVSVESFCTTTPLFGAVPELDSIATVTLLQEIETRFGVTIEDDDIDVSAFETVGTLTEFVQTKIRHKESQRNT